MVKAIWNDTIIAESEDTVIVEGSHYFPADSVKMELLQSSKATSFCGWKGMANYYTIVTSDGKSNNDCAWYYADPSQEAKHIRGRVAFWKGVKIEK